MAAVRDLEYQAQLLEHQRWHTLAPISFRPFQARHNPSSIVPLGRSDAADFRSCDG